MEIVCSVVFLQQPDTGPYYEPPESSPDHSRLFL